MSGLLGYCDMNASNSFIDFRELNHLTFVLQPTIATSYYFRDGAPSMYLTGGLGVTGLAFDGILATAWGPHAMVGAGWEFSRHWSIALTATGVDSGLLAGYGASWWIDYSLTLNVLGF